MVIIHSDEHLRKEFQKICSENHEPEKLQQALQAWICVCLECFIHYLEAHSFRLDLGERGSGYVPWNSTRSRKGTVNGCTFSLTLPRVRCCDLHFCQMVLPDLYVPYLSVSVEDALNICPAEKGFKGYETEIQL